jgi:branched-chain amino acid transport system ATP-binding protein
VTVEVELSGVRAGYGSVEVLHGLDLALPAGAVVAVAGRNGAGKTTLLRTIAGTLPLRAGLLYWRGQDITHLTAYQRAFAGVTFVPDEHNVFAGLTVRENLALFAGDAPVDPALSTFPELKALLDRRAGTLSGGEQQMLALCHAILRPGQLLLLDEVSRGLSPHVQTRIYAAIASLVSAQRAIVVVEQYLRLALQLADFVYVLRRGHVAFAGEPSELEGETMATALG